MRGSSWFMGMAVAAVGVAALTVTSAPGLATPEVHLTAAGDYGATSATAAVLDQIAGIGADAHLAIGDLSYGYSPTPYDWCSFVKQRVGADFAFQLISGNHESLDNNNGDINDFSACLPNQVPGITGIYGREYVMDFPRNAPLVRVIQASPNLTFEDGRWIYGRGDGHYQWLSGAIDAGRAKGARWIVVAAHYPCLTVGTNGCPSNTDFYDLLVEKHVDLVLHGHEHSYARTHQLGVGPGCTKILPRTTNSACIVDTDGAFGAGFGTVFATLGTGGVDLRDVNPSDSEAGYFAAWSGANSNPTHGVLDIVFSDQQLAATFAPADGSGFTDAFTITQGVPAPTTSTTSTTSTSTTSPSTTSTSTTSATTTTPDTSSSTSSTTSSTSSTTSTTAPSTSTTSTTTTTAPPSGTLAFASDAFERAVGSGWGTADLGGVWTSTSGFSVAGGAGRLTSTAGSARHALLTAVTSDETDLTLTLSTDSLPSGSGLYLSVIARSVGGSDYRSVVRYESTGRVTVRLDRATATISPAVVVPDVTANPGTLLDVRVQATGANPTTVRTKVWLHGTPEPAEWIRSITDSTSQLQAPGGLGIYSYLSSSAKAPVVISVDDLVATAP